MDVQVKDPDLLEGLAQFNEFFQQHDTLRNRLRELAAENEKLSVEITIMRERESYSSSTTMQSISDRLQKALEVLNKPHRDYKPAVNQLKGKVKALESTIENMKTQHIKEMCNLEFEKDRIVQEVKANRSPSAQNLDDSQNVAALKATIASLQERINKQFEEAEEKERDFEAQIHNLKEENQDLRKTIRTLEDEKFTHCPGSSFSSRGINDADFKTAKAKKPGKRKLFHPLDFTD